jgi:hypothetical protein
MYNVMSFYPDSHNPGGVSAHLLDAVSIDPDHDTDINGRRFA